MLLQLLLLFALLFYVPVRRAIIRVWQSFERIFGLRRVASVFVLTRRASHAPIDKDVFESGHGVAATVEGVE